jgi:di/tricarboxylate transporter
MTFEQAAVLALLAAMLVLFAVDRLRMELVALGGLAAGVGLGVVPAATAFAGFADPAFVTVLEILLVATVLSRSPFLVRLAARIAQAGPTMPGATAVICLVTAGLSVFMNNIGALALMLPVVYGVCRACGFDPRTMLMPVSFAALLGGMGSIIGTPANLIVSRQLEQATGQGFGFFDIGWIGIPVAMAGLVVAVLVVPRLIETAGHAPDVGAPQRRLVAEMAVSQQSGFVGRAFSELPVAVATATRGGTRLFLPGRDQRVAAGDLLLVDASDLDLQRLVAEGALAWPTSGETVQAVVMPESTVVGSRLGTVAGLGAGVSVVAVSPQARRIEGSLGDIQLSIGDVLHLAGEPGAIARALDQTDMLALTSQGSKAHDGGGSTFALAAFASAVLLSAAFGVAPHLAFGLVVLALVATGTLNLRTAIPQLNWPILVMLAAMIPLGTAVATTGAAQVLAGLVLAAVPQDSDVALIAAMLVLAIIVTPFVNNASTALVLGPIAFAVAGSAGIDPRPLLLAVAIGASIDFLTPFGHHNNTLVMGLAGYRFADFLKAGWAMTLVAAAVALAFLVL